MSKAMMPMPPEVTEFDPLTAHHYTTGVHLTAKFGNCRKRNPNRCDECGDLWKAGIVKRSTIAGRHVRLCPICRGKVTI